jgi:hypothetical protein
MNSGNVERLSDVQFFLVRHSKEMNDGVDRLREELGTQYQAASTSDPMWTNRARVAVQRAIDQPIPSTRPWWPPPELTSRRNRIGRRASRTPDRERLNDHGIVTGLDRHR